MKALRINVARLLLVLVCLFVCQSVVCQTNKTTVVGKVAVLVPCGIEIIDKNPHQPIHFSDNGCKQQYFKHVSIKSNCAWYLMVVPQNKNFCGNGITSQQIACIQYSIIKRAGRGHFNNLANSYQLYAASPIWIAGTGPVEFDVLFQLDVKKTKGWRWGNYNTKISFCCLPSSI